MTVHRREPPLRVLAAFGAKALPVPLLGGQGVTWRADGLVLKPTDNPTLAAWCADVLATVGHSDDIRIARPVSADEGWVVDGWTAWQWAAGVPADTRVHDIVAAGAAFHEALGTIPRPDLLDLCDDPWRHADRVAWGEQPLPAIGPYHDLLHRLAEADRPVSASGQLIHADLAGNVLFAPGLSPAIIDWSPYWRTAAWATAIIAVDGLDTGRVRQVDALALCDCKSWLSLLIKAEMYRLAAKNTAALCNIKLVDDKVCHRMTVDLLCRLAECTSPDYYGQN